MNRGRDEDSRERARRSHNMQRMGKKVGEEAREEKRRGVQSRRSLLFFFFLSLLHPAALLLLFLFYPQLLDLSRGISVPVPRSKE